jgi:hypothetical protein
MDVTTTSAKASPHPALENVGAARVRPTLAKGPLRLWDGVAELAAMGTQAAELSIFRPSIRENSRTLFGHKCEDVTTDAGSSKKRTQRSRRF